MPIVNFNVKGQAISLGWIIALLTLIACFVILIVGHATMTTLLFAIGALALAYVTG